MSDLSGAERKAQIRWASHDTRASTPWPCGWCSRAFGTERGANQHRRQCRTNPESHWFTMGGYDGRGELAATHVAADGRVTGWCWRGRSAEEERQIATEMQHILREIGADPGVSVSAAPDLAATDE